MQIKNENCVAEMTMWSRGRKEEDEVFSPGRCANEDLIQIPGGFHKKN
jgi:hypothetical protein